MINRSTLEATELLIASLNDSNRIVSVKDGTALAAMSLSSWTPITDYSETEDWDGKWLALVNKVDPYASTSGKIKGMTLGDQSHINVSTHSIAMERLVDLTSMGALNMMSIARNQAIPMINKVRESVEAHVQNLLETKETWSISEVQLDEGFSNNALRSAIIGMAKQHGGIIRSDLVPNLPFPRDLTVTTGSSAIDALFYSILDRCEITLEMVWADLFHADVGLPPLGGVKQNGRTLAQFILADHLINHPVENSGLTLSEWKDLLTRMTIAVGGACNRVIMAMEEKSNSEFVILDVNINTKVIYVEAKNYGRFLTTGGSPEAIIAVILSNGSWGTMTLTKLAESINYLMPFYETWHATRRSEQEAKMVSHTKNAIKHAVDGIMADLPEGTLSEYVRPEQVRAAYAKSISLLRESDLPRIAAAIREIVCTSIFADTACNFFLERMESFAEEGIAPSEAATLTVIEYVSDWVAACLNVSRRG